MTQSEHDQSDAVRTARPAGRVPLGLRVHFAIQRLLASDPVSQAKAALVSVVALFALGFIGFTLFMKLSERATEIEVNRVNDRVAADALERFEIVQRNGGSRPELCAQAHFVRAAYLQAHDEERYASWAAVARSYCD